MFDNGTDEGKHQMLQRLREYLTAGLDQMFDGVPEVNVVDVCQYPDRACESIYIIAGPGIVRIRLDAFFGEDDVRAHLGHEPGIAFSPRFDNEELLETVRIPDDVSSLIEKEE